MIRWRATTPKCGDNPMAPSYTPLIATPSDFGSTAGAQSVEALIARSRQRSVDVHRLDPAHVRQRALSPAALRDHREPLEPLLTVARSGMESLFLQIRDVGYVVLLTDAQGVAVEFINNPSVEREARRAGLAAGGCWTEDQEGTCAVGLALIDQLPLTVHHDEHFCVANRLLTCSAAPIFAADGRLLAVLDASALNSPDDRRSQHLVLNMVRSTARMIENANFLRQFERYLVLRTSSRREFLEVATEGLIAFDGSGHVVAANQRFLHDTGRSPSSLNRLHVEELFGVHYEALLAAAARPSAEPIRLRLLHSGSQCFALARGPRRQSPVARPRSGAAASAPGPGGGDALTMLAGLDPRMGANVNKARRVLDRGIAVLLHGESGTGKEAFAKGMHAASARTAAPFVALNCAAIPETLIESELFGHSEGAFTGARAKGARGKIAQAHGGTLFLDEIGDMPLALQTRLLRVLAEGEVTPLGAERAVPVDLQVICATHCDLDALVSAGRFRLDLYYRLNGLVLSLPPLRERSDKATLIDAILADEASSCADIAPRLSARAHALLLSHHWPGNIRQLRNSLRAALALCEGGEIDVEHLPAELSASTRPLLPPQRLSSISWGESPDRLELAASPAAAALLTTLQAHQWNVSAAARSLGLSRSTVYRRMTRNRIVEPNRRS
jgi:transcriptional regulator of acetoin/glycerol metabolism